MIMSTQPCDGQGITPFLVDPGKKATRRLRQPRRRRRCSAVQGILLAQTAVLLPVVFAPPDR